MLKSMLPGMLAVLFLASAAQSETFSPQPDAQNVTPRMAQPAEPRGPRLGGREALLETKALRPTTSAEFRFKRGDLEVDIRCAEDEAIKPCADAALTLLDKFGSVAAGLPEPAPPLP